MSVTEKQLARIRSSRGFIAALDQSGGSTPKALESYGVMPSDYNGDDEMFDAVHAMRTRIITSSAFTQERVLGAILFEMTMRREIEGMPTATYLWEQKQIVPFLKVDKGLAEQSGDVQIMKPMPALDALLAEARDAQVFGTKMRSVIHAAKPEGIKAVVEQQFEIGQRILEAGLMPIIEPEVSINAPDKAEAEQMLREEILAALEQLSGDQQVMLKLTLPETTDFYRPLVDHGAVLKVVALSGGYSLEESVKRLAANTGIIASFSRALTQQLDVNQSAESFDKVMGETIEQIYQASVN